jgi:hypothetical protein
MATTYNWTIAQLERQTDTGGVIVAHWRVTAQDGEYGARAYGSVGFTPDPASPTFKPYDQLTEADVLGWVWSQADFDKDAVEVNLAQRIEDQKAPKTETGVPW